MRPDLARKGPPTEQEIRRIKDCIRAGISDSMIRKRFRRYNDLVPKIRKEMRSEG